MRDLAEKLFNTRCGVMVEKVNKPFHILNGCVTIAVRSSAAPYFVSSAALFFVHLPPHFFVHLPPVHLPPLFLIFLFYIGKDQKKKVGGDHGRGGGRQGGGGGQQVVKEVNKKLVKEFNAGTSVR